MVQVFSYNQIYPFCYWKAFELFPIFGVVWIFFQMSFDEHMYVCTLSVEFLGHEVCMQIPGCAKQISNMAAAVSTP